MSFPFGRLFLHFMVFMLASDVVVGLNVWPMPKSVNYGSHTLYLSKDFELHVEGSYTDGPGILRDGFSRMKDIVFASHVITVNSNDSRALNGIVVEISSSDDTVLLFLLRFISF